jgi:hypothetical protein
MGRVRHCMAIKGSESSDTIHVHQYDSSKEFLVAEVADLVVTSVLFAQNRPP